MSDKPVFDQEAVNKTLRTKMMRLKGRKPNRMCIDKIDVDEMFKALKYIDDVCVTRFEQTASKEDATKMQNYVLSLYEKIKQVKHMGNFLLDNAVDVREHYFIIQPADIEDIY